MRSCGILLHISSLPSDYGIGTLGKEARRFVDFLKKGGHEYWQILPIGPTGYGDSPYQSFCAYAGNPLLVDLEWLLLKNYLYREDGDLFILIKKLQKKEFKTYEQLYAFKKPVLFNAATKFFRDAPNDKKAEYQNFCDENAFWLDDYALFMALKELFNGGIWTGWKSDIRLRKQQALDKYKDELADDIEAYKFIQYVFFTQYFELKKYANDKGVKIFGDMPIYVSPDSSDVWANPQLFMVDDHCKPTKVAGCPPDDYAKTGQLWGNPLYDWKAMEKDDYKWWIERVKYSAKLFDLTRIDHFRGFESFYAIPADAATAEKGEWLKGPGFNLFNEINKALGSVNLVAEDLGFLTPEVKTMLKATGYPGMNILQFAFGGDDSSYLPHNYLQNSVAYIGTHDNDTALGWYNSLDAKTRSRVSLFLGMSKSKTGVIEKMIRVLYGSQANLVILQMQDILYQPSKSRMNTPSTLSDKNWTYRIKKTDINDGLAKELRNFAEIYFRTESST